MDGLPARHALPRLQRRPDRPGAYAPEQRNFEKIEASARATAGVLAVLDAHLGDGEYVAGSSLTMGDVALGPLVYRWLELDIQRPDLPALQAWHERLETRPAYQKTVMVSFAKEAPPGAEA